MWTVYKITNKINEKVYIGLTVNFSERIRTHEVAANNTNGFQYFNPLYVEMRQFGFKNFEFSIVKSGIEDEEEAYKLESYYINHYDSIVDHGKGYNLNYGGKNGVHSDYTKIKMSNMQSGESNPSYGKKGKDAFASKGCINITDCICYGSMRECALTEYGDIKYVKQISKVCDPNSNRFTYKGKEYRKIENGEIVEKETSPLQVGKKVKIRDTITGIVFNNFSDAAKYYNLSLSQIRDRAYGRVIDEDFTGCIIN